MPRRAFGWTNNRFMPNRRSVVTALGLTLLAPGASSLPRLGVPASGEPIGTPLATPFEERRESAFRRLGRLNTSAVVAISHERGPVIVREFGASQRDSVPGAETQIDLNSITKTVTGVMVLKLVEQGQIRLDETLADFFPSTPKDKREITVHHLLTHTAGFTESVGDDSERLDREGFLRRAFETVLVATPGTGYHYSNVGFSILAAIIEERSGKPYDAYLQEDVLTGTGLTNTGYSSVYDDDRSLLSDDGRSILEASWGGHEPFWNLTGNGGLISTAEEFVRFRQAVTAGDILSRTSVEAGQTKHIAEDESGASHYGYGLVVQDVPAIGRVYWHDGGNDVFSAMWAEVVDQGDVIVTAAANAPTGDAIAVMEVLQQHLYGGVDG